MKVPFLLASLLASVQATKVFIPLYVYPATWETPNPWQYIYDTIASHPDIEFQVILNEVPKLNAFSNVHTFGHVPLVYGARPTLHVVQDVKGWANWNTYTEANISVNGIFFDSLPNDTQKKKQKKDPATMQYLTRVAQESFQSIPSFEIIFNPGTRIVDGLSPAYFELADQIVVYEQFAASYTTDAPLANNHVPEGMEDKSIILLHDFVESGLPDDAVEEWLQTFVEAGFGSANILNYGYEQCNSTETPASLDDIAKTLIAMDEGSPA